MTDWHNYEHKLGLGMKRIDRESFPEEDKDLIRGFIAQSQAQGVSAGRLYKLCWTLTSIRRQMPCNFREATRKEIETYVARLNMRTNYSANSKSDTKKILKRFYKFVRNGNADKLTPYPPEVAWIKTEIKKNEQTEPEVLTEDETKKLVEAATSARTKAFISVISEGGFRIGEMLSATIGDVLFDEHGARLTVRGKTGQRTVRLIISAPILGMYLQDHPLKHEPHAPLWLKFGQREEIGPLKYGEASSNIKKAARIAGIKKRIYPHLFRHSSATRDSSYGLNERSLEIKYGWARGSRVSSRYNHFQDVNVVDKQLLGIYAGKQIEPPKPELVLTECPRCRENNSPGMVYCGKCGSPLRREELARASAIDLETLKEQVSQLSTSGRDLERGLDLLFRYMEPFLELGRKLKEEDEIRMPSVPERASTLSRSPLKSSRVSRPMPPLRKSPAKRHEA